MDVLSDVLAAVRLTGAIFFDSTFREPWVAEAPKASVIAANVMPDSQYVFFFHTLLEGSCWVEMIDGSEESIRLEAGDIIAFPMDDAHALCSAIGMRAKPDLANYHHPIDHQLPYVVNEGSGVGSCRFVCGYLGCDIRPYNPFIKALPRVLHGRGTANQDWLVHLVHHAVSETDRGRPGAETILAKLAELMFVQVIREYVDGLPADARGWLSGLKDRHIGHALRLIHGQPAADWTLEMPWRGRSGCRGQCSLTGSPTMPPIRRCSTWPAGVCSLRRACWKTPQLASRRRAHRSATTRKRPSTGLSRRSSVCHRAPGARTGKAQPTLQRDRQVPNQTRRPASLRAFCVIRRGTPSRGARAFPGLPGSAWRSAGRRGGRCRSDRRFPRNSRRCRLRSA